MAEQQQRTIGDVVSGLARKALRQPAGTGERHGIPLLPVTNPRAQVTLAVVNAPRCEAP
jgi:hypothetical protein